MLYDLSIPLTSRLPTWPGDPAIELVRSSRIEEGALVNLTRIGISSHSGTHLDAPYHFLADGQRLWEIPLDRLVGPCWVADCRGSRMVTAAQLEAAAIPPTVTRLLLATDNSALWQNPAHAFRRDFVALSGEGAAWIAARGIQLVGIDYMSIDAFDAEDAPAHNMLLARGIIVIENLDLRQVPLNRSYELICLPLPLAEGGDGAPVRAVLRTG